MKNVADCFLQKIRIVYMDRACSYTSRVECRFDVNRVKLLTSKQGDTGSNIAPSSGTLISDKIINL